MSSTQRKKTGDLAAAMAQASSDIPAARNIPMGAPISPYVIKLRENGDLVSTWRLHGMSFETASEGEIGDAKRQLVNFLHSVRASDRAEPTAIWVHRVRRKTTDRLEGKFTSNFAAQLDKKYWDGLSDKQMLRNELYFSLVMRPTQGMSRADKKARLKNAEALIDHDKQALERMEVLCGQVSASMHKYGGRRLGTYERLSGTGKKITCSEQGAFYKWLITGVHEELPLQTGPMAEYLCDARIFAGDTNGIVQISHPSKKTFIGYMDLLDYPAVTEPGINNCLFNGSYEFVESQSFSFLSKREGIEALELQMKRLISSGEGSPEQIGDMEHAIEDVKNGRVFMGEYHYSLGIFGDDVRSTQQNMAMARTSLQEDSGFKVATVDLVPECAHFAQLPGNWKWRTREAKLTSKNFASLAPLHNYDMGKRDGNPWGAAVTMLETPARQPYYFNFHDSPMGKNSLGEKVPGNTFICGQTGSGKTAFMGFLFCQLMKVPKLRGLFFDKDRGGETMIRALRGRYRQLRRGEPTGFNPFQWEPTPRNVQFVKSLVLQCASRGGQDTLNIREENALFAAVDRVFALPNKQDRRISAILQFTGADSDLGARLVKWCRTRTKVGDYAWVLDNAHDTTDFSGASIFGFDCTDFLGDMECGPVIIAYILEAAETLLNGDPFFYVMEEFAKLVASKAQTLVEFARDKQTTIRKLNGFGIFVTQSPSQVNSHPIGATLREQCVTQIFLPNPAADYTDYVDGFKLTETEFGVIKQLALDSRTFLVKQGSRSALCKLDLGHMREELEVISGTMDNVVLLDQLRAELGSEDPDVWMGPFLRGIQERKRLASKTPAMA